eukprot:scaffold11573_cov18-Tisochrysis_lutea.AAC.2
MPVCLQEESFFKVLEDDGTAMLTQGPRIANTYLRKLTPEQCFVSLANNYMSLAEEDLNLIKPQVDRIRELHGVQAMQAYEEGREGEQCQVYVAGCLEQTQFSFTKQLLSLWSTVAFSCATACVGQASKDLLHAAAYAGGREVQEAVTQALIAARGNRKPVDSGRGVRIQGGRVYDSRHGITCHWCVADGMRCIAAALRCLCIVSQLRTSV